MVQPIIKWAGGKSKIKEEFGIIYQKSNCELFIDLFCGSLCLPLSINCNKIIINDINSSLINCYKIIKKYPKLLIKQLEIYNKQEYNNKIEFNKIREDYNCIKLKDKLTKSEKIKFACYFIYLNKRSFNGLYRENKSGLYNVPFRKYNSDIFKEEKIVELSNFLNNHNVKIKNNNIFDMDLLEIIKKYKIDNLNILVYLDPPYYPSKKSKFTGYNKEIFNVNEQEKLKDLCDKLNQNNIKFIMSNSPCDEVKKLYQNYQQKELYIGRQMRSGQGISQVYSEKNKSNEILIWNF